MKNRNLLAIGIVVSTIAASFSIIYYLNYLVDGPFSLIEVIGFSLLLGVISYKGIRDIIIKDKEV